jgi:hypothetical protein
LGAALVNVKLVLLGGALVGELPGILMRFFITAAETNPLVQFVITLAIAYFFYCKFLGRPPGSRGPGLEAHDQNVLSKKAFDRLGFTPLSTVSRSRIQIPLPVRGALTDP